MTAKHGQPAPIHKRSYSTPAVRTMMESTSITGEKRRNKLGYHRASTACGKSGSFLRRGLWLGGQQRGSSGPLELAQVMISNQGYGNLGHCRRRKIRCIVSPEMQHRCISCIRLKKDCSFFPVDQQSGRDSQGKSTGQGTGRSTAPSQSTLPALGAGHPVAMASVYMYGTGPIPDAIGHAAPTAPSLGYVGVACEGLLARREGFCII